MSTKMLSGCMLGMLSSKLHFGNFVCAIHCSASIEQMVLLTSPMRGRGSSNRCACVCVCVSVTTLASATNALKAKVRYQQKALDARAGNKINVGIELKILGSKVMTVISIPWNLYLALTAGNRRQQVTSVVRRISLVRQALRLHL